jgi:hypothetical protein
LERAQKIDRVKVQAFVYRVRIYQHDERLGNEAEEQGPNYPLHDTQGHFLASFALGEKAVKAAHEDDLPVSVLKIIDNAKKYAEGRGVRIEVKNGRDVRNVEKLATIKMST